MSLPEWPAKFFFPEKLTNFKQVLNLKDSQSVYIECLPAETMIKTVIQNFEYGFASALILNRSKTYTIDIKQNGEQ